MSEEIPTSRVDAAAMITEAPERFKICESCGSIVASAAALCPNCQGYRFDVCVDRVVEQARMLATRAPLSVEFHDYL